jgi:hypothetical protein
MVYRRLVRCPVDSDVNHVVYSHNMVRFAQAPFLPRLKSQVSWRSFYEKIRCFPASVFPEKAEEA